MSQTCGPHIEFIDLGALTDEHKKSSSKDLRATRHLHLNAPRSAPDQQQQETFVLLGLESVQMVLTKD